MAGIPTRRPDTPARQQRPLIITGSRETRHHPVSRLGFWIKACSCYISGRMGLALRFLWFPDSGTKTQRRTTLLVGVILFKKFCTTTPCRGGRAPPWGIAHHRAERGRDVGRAPGLSSHQNALCRVSRVRAAWFGRCAPWSLLGQASAGKEVEAREAVAWQAPVGPSDDGIRGAWMHQRQTSGRRRSQVF